ncbi:integrase catalytic domain-containing protein [Trichonephila clavipes]|nr:integrase catalytic domain-containing protein [Trichonephila clavipes]
MLSCVLNLSRTRFLIIRFSRDDRRIFTVPSRLIKFVSFHANFPISLLSFREEINVLNRKQILKNSKLYSLHPYLDVQGILRISSRINEAKFHSHEINQIIIPKESKFTELIVKEKHLRLLHGEVTLTLSQIRRKYWIPQGRQLIRKIINRCVACKYSVKPADQLSGQLPHDRISQSLPFTVIGVDFTGPVYVKLGNDTEKSYIALFTCAVTRAVHIELESGLFTRKFILALRRFLSRRSNCKTIYSDNASTFKCASKEIQYFFNIIKDEDLKFFISSEGIT